MSTSQQPGIVKCLGTEHLLDAYFENVFQGWLSEALELPQRNVRPAVELDLTQLPDLEDAAVFFPTNVRASAYETSQTDDGLIMHYSGEVAIQVTICGIHARELAMLLRDTFSINQNDQLLHERLGLGFVSANIVAFTLEQRGRMMCPRADVNLTFNYKYSRLWAVFPIESAKANIQTS